MNRSVFLVFCILVMAVVAGVYFLGFGAPQEYPSPSPRETRPEVPVVEVTSTLPVSAPTAKVCHPSGCSSQICSDEDVVTDCMYKEQYICYQKATCERQQDGKCGWTNTPDLQACLTQYE